MEAEVHLKSNGSIHGDLDAGRSVFVARLSDGSSRNCIGVGAAVGKAEGSVSLGKSTADQSEGDQAKQGSHLVTKEEISSNNDRIN